MNNSYSSENRPFRERLLREMTALEAAVDSFCRTTMPQLEAKVEELTALLSRCRKEYLLLSEAAKLLGRSSYTVRRWITHGKLKAFRDCGRHGKFLVPRADLDRLMSDAKGQKVPNAMVMTGGKHA